MTDDACPILTEMTYLEPLDLFPTYQYITKLNDQISKLTIDLNTQNPRVEVEKVKRPKMHMLMRQIRNEMTHTNPIINQ